MRRQEIRRSVFIALFAALISAGCVMAIPLPGGVPISLQNFFCILAGAILGSWRGAAAVCAWAALGAAGVPVFANAHGGPAVLMGPTGGYIAGYALGSLATGLLLGTPGVGEGRTKRGWVRLALCSLAGYALVYAPGIPWFMRVMGAAGKPQTFGSALSLAFVPFVPGDLVKLALTVAAAGALRPVAARYLSDGGADAEAEAQALAELEAAERADSEPADGGRDGGSDKA